MKTSSVKLRIPKDWKLPSGNRVWIDGHEIEGIKTVQLRHEAGNIRLLTLEIFCDVEITQEELPDDHDGWEIRTPETNSITDKDSTLNVNSVFGPPSGYGQSTVSVPNNG